ncbi:hypothetical protein D9757_007954 [Collybiopsis confluens]|uniref:Fungal-type protein kinase domain-containing protein n=1 Tax=Collybiopsis confluens TaxID=2823264 RepID=A0A8H5M3W0_9AGAR|nr:hypothetical protein D9757_007954 [Collybiopsis confluens]
MMSTPLTKAPAKPNTPPHARMSSTQPFTSTSEEYDSVFVVAANEMAGKYFGPISTKEFLDHYLPDDGTIPAMPQIDTGSFAKVASTAVERWMYEPMISALQPFCRGITLLDSSNHEDSHPGVFHGRRIKPDISMYADADKPPSNSPTNSRTMLGFMEFKNDLSDEPFSDWALRFERDAVRPRDTRGQIAVYNTTIAASQFRTRIFSVFVNGSSCRLMCATRSGTSVTESFNYIEDSSLATFFWRLSHSSPEARGIDTTFKQVTEEGAEAQAARSALALESSAILYRVSVVDKVADKTLFFIVSEPFTTSHLSPTGRCTRCFHAYNTQRGKVVVLKDNWRVDGYDPEGETYRLLNSVSVPHIPLLVAAGDVSGPPGSTCGNEPFLGQHKHRIHSHYRLVLDTVGHSLTHFESTWQLVRVILDALIAHQVAYQKCSRLHRDISSGNIIITEEGRGMLIDWELSKDVRELGPRSYERTGTWQFRSVRLLQATEEDEIQHSVGDDIESFLWVLSWVLGRNAPSSMTDIVRADFLQAFDQLAPGGSTKKKNLGCGGLIIRDLKLATPQVADLLIILWLQFGGRYGTDNFFSEQLRSKESARKWLQSLESHDWMMKQLELALADEDWKKLNDGRVAYEVVKSKKILTEGQKKRKSAMSAYGPFPLPKKPRMDEDHIFQ